MLAPPGYAKIVSTPSRSRQATRISLPDIVGPSSFALVEGAVFAFSVVLLITLLCVVLAVGRESIIQKPTTVWQPWVFVEIFVTLDKHLRHRHLRRLRQQLVELLVTFRAKISCGGEIRQALFARSEQHLSRYLGSA